jgi:hypothetical protein
MTHEDGVRRWSRLRPYHLGKVRRHFHIHPSNRLPVFEPVSQGDAAQVAAIDPICLHIAFRSPEGHDARSAENDWLRAGKRAMCVSIF